MVQRLRYFCGGSGVPVAGGVLGRPSEAPRSFSSVGWILRVLSGKGPGLGSWLVERQSNDASASGALTHAGPLCSGWCCFVAGKKLSWLGKCITVLGGASGSHVGHKLVRPGSALPVAALVFAYHQVAQVFAPVVSVAKLVDNGEFVGAQAECERDGFHLTLICCSLARSSRSLRIVSVGSRTSGG